MNRILFLLTIIILFSGCGSKSERDKSSQSIDSIVVDSNIITNVDSITVDSATEGSIVYPIKTEGSSVEGKKLFRVSGIVYVSQKYCSGIRPPDAIREEAERYKPRSGVKVAFRLGKSNSNSSIVASSVTNSNGQYMVQLPAGTYCMIVDEQTGSRDLYRNSSGAVAESSTACFSKWWDECQSIITITNSNLENQDILLNQNCLVNSLCPCIINRSGQMRP